jgi:hypothetical protein
MKRVILIGVLVIEIAVALTLVPVTNHARLQTTDFVNFYAAASVVRDGHGSVLYQRETQDAALESILEFKSTQYFLHPAFEAAAFVPLSYLPIERAFVVWSLINVGLLGLLPLVLMPCVPLVARRPYVALLGFAFLPALTALTLGQDSILLLFVLSMSYLLLYRRQDMAAGLVLALAGIKFQYLLILVPLLLAWRKYRLAAGFGLGCACLAFLSLLITRPRGILEYFRFLREFDIHSGYGSLNPTLMVNWRGFLSGLGETSHTRAYTLAGGIVLFAVGLACSQLPENGKKHSLIFALYVTIALAAAPYAHFPDMTLLLLPILLVLDYVAAGQTSKVARRLVTVCCVSMFVWPLVLLAMGGHYWWNSRIYLVFPLVVFFVIAIASLILQRQNILGPVATVASGSS